MNAKSILILSATLLLIGAFRLGVLRAGFEKKGDGTSRAVLTIDKNARAAMKVRQDFHEISQAAGAFSCVIFCSAGGPELVKKCKDDPVLFGGLFVFFGVCLCGISWVIHMIRSDSRLG
jgi:hypothetical protein